MPCTGCFGPTSHVKDFGAKALSAMASLVEARMKRRCGGDRVDPRSGRYLLPLQPAGLVAGEEANGGEMMSTEPHPNRITIDPITRLEGHGKIDIFLNDEGGGSGLLPGARSCAASRNSPRAVRPKTCRRSPRASAASARRPTTWPPPRRWTSLYKVHRRRPEENPRAGLQHLHRRRPRPALLLPGRAGLRGRSDRAHRRTEHPRRPRQGRRSKSG